MIRVCTATSVAIRDRIALKQNARARRESGDGFDGLQAGCQE
jgi:hypothetical protein